MVKHNQDIKYNLRIVHNGGCRYLKLKAHADFLPCNELERIIEWTVYLSNAVNATKKSIWWAKKKEKQEYFVHILN